MLVFRCGISASSLTGLRTASQRGRGCRNNPHGLFARCACPFAGTLQKIRACRMANGSTLVPARHRKMLTISRAPPRAGNDGVHLRACPQLKASICRVSSMRFSFLPFAFNLKWIELFPVSNRAIIKTILQLPALKCCFSNSSQSVFHLNA